MSRYFIEVAYLGGGFAGFQVQDNAQTIQGELERAMETLFRQKLVLTGSSRTDTGVHARQNYFHFDFEGLVDRRAEYSLNALLPDGIAVRSIRKVAEDAHCRFDAVGREYRYLVYRHKDPFLRGRGYYFPYVVDAGEMQAAARVVLEYSDFSAFSKRHSQVKSYVCKVGESGWAINREEMVYCVRSNRFLRGMVRGLVGTMLQVGRGRMSVAEFRAVVEGMDQRRADFSVPGCGLYLEKVVFPEGYFG